MTEQRDRRLLQIVPHLPGTRDGVGDYALTLARKLRERHRFETVFAIARSANTTEVEGFRIVPLRLGEALAEGCDHALLHYVNYAYQTRGVPSALRDFAAALRAQLRGRWITMFHELYASGAPWRSAFWLRPLQVRIARSLIELSDICFVSNEPIAREVARHDPAKRVRLLPVMSNFGEPQLTSFDDRLSQRWTICGGSALIERSIRSFAAAVGSIPPWCAPERLDVIGGYDDATIRNSLARLQSAHPSIVCHRFPDVAAENASHLLRESSFAWIDYFGSGKVWPGMIFKSGSFAACCAHAVIPVLAHNEAPLGCDGDLLPGPFSLSPAGTRLPAAGEIARVREQIYCWYQRHASAATAVEAYAEALS